MDLRRQRADQDGQCLRGKRGLRHEGLREARLLGGRNALRRCRTADLRSERLGVGRCGALPDRPGVHRQELPGCGLRSGNQRLQGRRRRDLCGRRRRMEADAMCERDGLSGRGGQGELRAAAVQPREQGVQGEVVQLCANDGLSVSPGEDCGNPGPGGAAQVCLGGKCVPAGCTAGATSCADDGALLTCKGDGAGWISSACGEGKTCLGGACVAQSCVPGKKACAGALVMVCNANGTDQEIAQDCGLTSDACGDGVCEAGACAIAAKSCDDGKVCTVDACEASKGCTHVPGSGACEDGDACTEADTCADGVCKPGPAKSCDDGNPCTADACVAAKGCTNEAGSEGASCAAVDGGVCKLGQCVASCPFGYEAVEIDKGGVKAISCAAVQQVWGLRPESTAGLLKVETIGGGKVLVDSGTGMMWEPGVVQGSKKWDDAVKACDELVHAGFEDWRLPTLWEAVALMDWSDPKEGCVTTAVSTLWKVPASKFEDLTIWTRTSTSTPSQYHFSLLLRLEGDCLATSANTSGAAIRCVRTHSTVAANGPRFSTKTVSGTSIVVDAWTEREWLDPGASEIMTFDAAKAWCAAQKTGGAGWRLPTFRELYGILGEYGGSTYFDSQHFVETVPAGGTFRANWTSSLGLPADQASTQGNTDGVAVGFIGGTYNTWSGVVHEISSVTGKRWVRCVR